jgi:hypothetical protein
VNKFIHIPKKFDCCEYKREMYINVSRIICVERASIITLRLDNDECEHFDIKAWKYFAEALGESKTEGEILG